MVTCGRCGKVILEGRVLCAECAAAQVAPQFHPDFVAPGVQSGGRSALPVRPVRTLRTAPTVQPQRPVVTVPSVQPQRPVAAIPSVQPQRQNTVPFTQSARSSAVPAVQSLSAAPVIRPMLQTSAAPAIQPAQQPSMAPAIQPVLPAQPAQAATPFAQSAQPAQAATPFVQPVTKSVRPAWPVPQQRPVQLEQLTKSGRASQAEEMPVSDDPTGSSMSAEYRPLSAWAYVGYQILFLLPLIGLIFLLVFSLGGTRNVNLRNLAVSYFCALLIVLVLAAVAVTLMVTFHITLPTLLPGLM